MKPDQGLFQADFDDHHAVLGVPISADAKAVRKRYLTIARKLHPDSLSGASSVAEAQQASEILSKLVNPAYEALSQEKSSTEHGLILKLKGQTLRRTGTAPAVTSTAAQELLKAPHLDAAYRQAVNALAVEQFDRLERLSEVMGALSELNLVYLYRSTTSDRTSASSPATPARAASRSQSTSAQPAPPPSPRQNQAAILGSYVNRAQEYEINKDYSRAILELREALKTYPNDVTCHSYLSSLYLKAGQGTMARIHAKRALEIDANDERAKAVQARVDRASGTATSGSNTASAKANPKSADKGTSDKGGGFFGLFGGKKK
ncbi:J domain-containing protein [Nodosilinea sp. AN01ver1]|uniref:J domain-containing protein n=1 Tax=Nodosilinea sp. AN01ver1 TaxID=3423362 RepID=UPI003D31CB56